jgi:hypothetical protein
MATAPRSQGLFFQFVVRFDWSQKRSQQKNWIKWKTAIPDKLLPTIFNRSDVPKWEVNVVVEYVHN